MENYESLSIAVDALTKEGYNEDFKANENYIKALYSKKEYLPKDLKIVKSFRFEGITDPDDESEVFALIANDGTKGTLVMSYSAKHSQNVELIRQLKKLI